MRLGLQILTGTLVFACGALPGTLAADPPRFDVTPMVGYRMGGEFEVVDPEATSGTSIDLDEGTSFGIDLGLYRDSNSFYELLYSRQESGFDSPDVSIGSVDLATEYLHFGGTLLFPDEYWYVPWISLTVGDPTTARRRCAGGRRGGPNRAGRREIPRETPGQLPTYNTGPRA